MQKGLVDGAHVLRRWLIHHYGTNDQTTLQKEFDVGARMVSVDTIELVDWVQSGQSSNRWVFEDLVRMMNVFLAEMSPPLEAELMDWFSVQVGAMFTEVRVRVGLRLRQGGADD